jgi:hypothetical protein
MGIEISGHKEESFPLNNLFYSTLNGVILGEIQ